MGFEKIEWKDQYSVGVKGIDNQHKQLIVLINVLNETTQSGALTTALLNSIISQLTHYTKYHFTYEEVLFRKYNYSETKEHTNEHQNFVKKIEAFAQVKPEEISDQILEFLNNWLITHILKSDMKYAELFQKSEAS